MVPFHFLNPYCISSISMSSLSLWSISISHSSTGRYYVYTWIKFHSSPLRLHCFHQLHIHAVSLHSPRLLMRSTFSPELHAAFIVFGFSIVLLTSIQVMFPLVPPLVESGTTFLCVPLIREFPLHLSCNSPPHPQ